MTFPNKMAETEKLTYVHMHSHYCEFSKVVIITKCWNGYKSISGSVQIDTNWVQLSEFTYELTE